jgi:hypothetical protein
VVSSRRGMGEKAIRPVNEGRVEDHVEGERLFPSEGDGTVGGDGIHKGRDHPHHAIGESSTEAFLGTAVLDETRFAFASKNLRKEGMRKCGRSIRRRCLTSLWSFVYRSIHFSCSIG